jgi:S-DNA-T family DNA segregation ATPase FtsK/SpoIIIE
MPLHCALVRSPGARLREPPVELTIDAPSGTTGEQLQAELSRAFGTGTVTVDGVGILSMRIGEPPLVNGAVLVDGPGHGLRRRDAPEPPASLALAVHSGPGAGIVVPLRRGTYGIGRSSTEIIIPDAELSRAHARLVVADTAITIEDLDSANGTEVDGERIRSAVVSTGSTIRCGNSTMSLIFLELPDADLHEAGTSVQEPLVVSRRVEPGNRGALLLTAALPLVIGVGLAVVTGMWMFLAFTALSAISIAVPAFSGRRQRRALSAAVSATVLEDKERRRRSAPPLSDLMTAGHLPTARPGAPAALGGGIWLRLGQAVQPANIRFDPADPERELPSAGLTPVTLDPARAVTSIRGPRAAVDGLLRSVLMQLGGYPQGSGTLVVVHSGPRFLPLEARYLPGVTLSGSRRTLEAVLERGHGPSYRHAVLILTGDVNASDADSGIIAKALQRGWQVLDFCHGGDATADIELGAHSSMLRTHPEGTRFVPDLVPADVFGRFCRRLARDAARPREGEGAVPESCSLADLIPPSPEDTAARWTAGRRSQGLAVPVGRAADGERVLDLHTDGPHLLVAGTTGSGKSEFLRSLTMAMALCYPPDRINFLFVDFKGGSGLGPLTGLPHCVGMLTDLTSHELERSLASLRAEIRLREQLLAAAEAPDLASYRASETGQDSPLPHLVLVIDEFRMLVEEAPEALRELMRIAAIGRSLGIHLVMATQRPQGALTADIRANVTTSIALRVQSEMESLDIINSKSAAAISVDTPGRAYLARGTEAPQEFQAASLVKSPAVAEFPGIMIRLATEALQAAAANNVQASDPHDETPAHAAAPLVASLVDLWAVMGGGPARRPVAAPLPCVLEEQFLEQAAALVEQASTASLPTAPQPAGIGRSWSVRLGLMDLPEEQRLTPLIWEPARHGHLGLIGGPDSGAREALALTVRKLAAHSTESHFYILDGDSSISRMSSHSRVGAQAGLHELRRAVRILERLAREQSRRLSHPADADEPPLVLVITGWGSWVSAFRSGPLAWAEDLVQDLVRDGGSAGITVLLAGQRELVTARFFASVPNRMYFPTGSNEDSRLAWPRMPATAAVRGRAVAFGAVSAGKPVICQFCTPSPETKEIPPDEALRQVPVLRRPFRVDPLPALVPARQVLAQVLAEEAGGFRGPRSGTAGQRHRRLHIGVGGDEPEPVSIRMTDGGVLAVLGGPSSGKTNFLLLLPRLNSRMGPWLSPDAGVDQRDYWSGVLRRASAGEVDGQAVLLVDDADLLPAAAKRDLSDLNTMGFAVVLTARFSTMLVQTVPLLLNARSQGTGVLIAPRSLADGDLFGVRFEVESNPPPGRGVLISEGRTMAVQLGWAPPELQPDVRENVREPEVIRPSGMHG